MRFSRIKFNIPELFLINLFFISALLNLGIFFSAEERNTTDDTGSYSKYRTLSSFIGALSVTTMDFTISEVTEFFGMELDDDWFPPTPIINCPDIFFT